MKNFIKSISTHLPAYIAGALVVINALEQAGTITLSTKVIIVVNALLAAFGLGILHVRQQATKTTTPTGK